MEIQKETSEETLKAQARKISIREGAASSLMDGFGVRNITPYALALKATNHQIALLSSLPGLLGNISQIFTIHMMREFSRKKIVFISVLSQALAWLPILAIGIFYYLNKITASSASKLIIIVYSLMVVAGAFSGPAWNSWMRDIITPKSGEYFSRRNRITTTTSFVCMILAGLILDYFKHSNIFIGFAIIFSLALGGRTISAILFIKKYEPKFEYSQETYFTFRQFIKKMPFNNFGRFVIFISIMSLTIAIASPFFAVYMLKNLALPYTAFTFITLSSVISTLIFLPVWGKFSDKYGHIKILKITGALMSLIPALWLFSATLHLSILTSTAYLFVVEFLSGIIFAGFNFSAANFVYDAVTKQRMPLCVAYFNTTNALGAFIGAIFGGFVASYDFQILSLSPILFIFLLSAVLRIIAFIIIAPFIKEVKEVLPFDVKKHISEKIKLAPLALWNYTGFKPLRLKSE